MSIDQDEIIKNYVDLNRNQTTLRRTKDAVTDRGVVVVDGKERSESPETLYLAGIRVTASWPAPLL